MQISRSSVRAVSERTDEQRDVIVLVAVAHVERDLGLGKQRPFDAVLRVIVREIERQAVRAGHDLPPFGQRRYTPLLVGRSAADGRPLAALPDLENHRHAYGGSALRQIEYVARDHFLISRGAPPPRAAVAYAPDLDSKPLFSVNRFAR